VPARGWLDIARLEIEIQLAQETPNWQGAEAALDHAEKVNPDAVIDVTLLRADMLGVRGQVKEAEALLAKARDEHPREVQLWSALADLARLQKHWADAKDILDRGAQLGDSVLLRLAQ